ncbi:MAG TPA: hypothetical protein VF175_16975 [Lacipirellula sp.]
MPVLIGVDEAGYGPNLGPLCVAATAWKVKERGDTGQGTGGSKECVGAAVKRAVASPPTAAATGGVDLYKLLRKAVARTPDKAGRKLAIADSKALYTAGVGVEQLERGVLAAIASMGAPSNGSGTLPANAPADAGCVARVSELLAATAADPDKRRRELDCHFDDEQRLPIEAEAQQICKLAAKLRAVCEEQGVALLAVRARLVYPAEFNELVEHFGNKGAALSHITLELVRRVVDEVSGITPAAPGSARGSLATGTESILMETRPRPEAGAADGEAVHICLDKHGGRNRYAALLQHHFPDSWIATVSENRNRSRYRWQHGDSPMEALFRVGCEELLPTALASMTAKYHREVAMRAFNAFWTSRLPALQPTAGYPGDSHRFKADIAGLQAELGIEDRLLWRCR